MIINKEIQKKLLEEINKKWIAFLSSNISAEDCISDTIDFTIAEKDKEIALMKSEQEKELLGMKGGKSIFSLGFVSGQQHLVKRRKELFDGIIDNWVDEQHPDWHDNLDYVLFSNRDAVEELKQKLKEAVK